MSEITLQNARNKAYLANTSYGAVSGDKKDDLPQIGGAITNPATNSSFEVVKQVNDDTTGFSGTVFKDPVSGEYTISFRGTQLGDLKDWATDFGDMLIDLNNRQFKGAMWFANKQILVSLLQKISA